MFDKKIIGLILFSSLCFVLLGALVSSSPPSGLDIHVSKEVQEEVNEKRPIDFSSPMALISIFGNGAVSVLSVLGIALIFWITSNKREAVFTLLVFVSNIVNFIIKLIFNRPRPSSDTIQVLGKFDHSSFPSGHVTHYVVFFGFLLVVIFYRKLFPLWLRLVFAICLVILIGTIPISRVYLGAHWATDVIGGYLIGLILLSIMLGFYFQEEKRFK